MHTPGPWEAKVMDKQLGRYAIQSIPRASMVARTTPPVACVAGEIEANARLIAAAPELLAAAKVAQHYLAKVATNTPACEEAERALFAAIAKAEGA